MENRGVSLTFTDSGENRENAIWFSGRFKAWEGASGRLSGETAKVRGFEDEEDGGM